jgi:hypothetical protein
MANYVQNRLRVVEGDPKEVFAATRGERTIFDFRKLVPVPDEIATSNEEVERHGVMVPLSKAWTAENWGTTRNAVSPSAPKTTASTSTRRGIHLSNFRSFGKALSKP